MVSTPLKNISQLGWLIPNMWKKCSKPPTSIYLWWLHIIILTTGRSAVVSAESLAPHEALARLGAALPGGLHAVRGEGQAQALEGPIVDGHVAFQEGSPGVPVKSGEMPWKTIINYKILNPMKKPMKSGDLMLVYWDWMVDYWDFMVVYWDLMRFNGI